MSNTLTPADTNFINNYPLYIEDREYFTDNLFEDVRNYVRTNYPDYNDAEEDSKKMRLFDAIFRLWDAQNSEQNPRNQRASALEQLRQIVYPEIYTNFNGVTDNLLLEQIERIERFLTQNPNLDEEFVNAFNEDLANTKAELERRNPITGAVADARRAETARRIEEMRANTARLAVATAKAKAEDSVFGECALCLEPINYGDEAVDAHDINGKKSGHIFHKDCIMNICNSNGIKVCPECRAPLLCEEIVNGERGINTNLGLQGGKRKRRKSKSKKSKKSRKGKRHVTKRRSQRNK
jgi:hypothetical protein